MVEKQHINLDLHIREMQKETRISGKVNQGMEHNTPNIVDADESWEYHRKLMTRINNMSVEERKQTLIRSGILTEDMRLTKRYGGKG